MLLEQNVSCTSQPSPPHRSAGTHQMSRWTRALFFRFLPRFLCMDAPGAEVDVPGAIGAGGSDAGDDDAPYDPAGDPAAQQSDLARLANPFKTTRNRLNPSESDLEQIYGNAYISSSFIGVRPEHLRNVDMTGFCRVRVGLVMCVCLCVCVFVCVCVCTPATAPSSSLPQACSARKWDASRRYPPHMLKALDGTAFVAKHMKDDDDSTKVSRESDKAVRAVMLA